MSVRYLTLVEILEIHRQLIEKYGGHPGVREPGALESALIRPQMGYYESLPEQAAALMESLAMNHPFADGNKRVAFAATDTFLRLNGHRIHGEPIRIHQDWMRFFEQGKFDYTHLLPWLQTHIKPL